MKTKQLQMRHFHIVDLSGPIDACAQFMYKDYMISMSTIGLSKGSCQHEVEIYHKDNLNKPATDNGFHTVEEAILFINDRVLLNQYKNDEQACGKIVGLCEMWARSNMTSPDQADDVKKPHGIVGKNNE